MVEDKRLKIGLIFNFSPSWMGGIIYMMNIVKLFNFLDENQQPELYVFYKKNLKRFVDELDYPNINKVEGVFPNIQKGYLLSFLRRKNLFIDPLIEKYQLDVVYPVHDFPVRTRTNAKVCSWYADLQHKHYPEFFSWKKKLQRNLRIHLILKKCNTLIVSSQSVKDDFTTYYNIPDTINIHIFRFVSLIDSLPDVSIIDLRKKYNLPEKYFIVSNQFHKHKNHIVIFKALALLKEKESKPAIHIAFTGRFPSIPDSPYMQELHDIMEQNDLSEQISLMGLVPRGDQLILMKYAQAVIQPSLFEGWSTVIEDAISLQVPVVASSLPVNIEQLGDKGTFFEPHDEKTLAEILQYYPGRNLNDVFYDQYEDRVQNAARALAHILKS